MGFFENVFILAYWMLRPSKYKPQTSLWVWTPNYDDDDEDEDSEGENGGGDVKAEDTKGGEEKGEARGNIAVVKRTRGNRTGRTRKCR